MKFRLICLCLTLLIISSLFNFFANYENISYDLRFRLRPAQKISPDTIIIEISDDTLKNLGNWPLPRDFHASLVDVLKEQGAGAVVFDVLFSEPTIYDEIFSRAIKNAGNVYLPLAFDIKDKSESNQLLADIEKGLKQSALGYGHVNILVDPDGKVRRLPLYIKYNSTLIPQLGFKVASDWLKSRTHKLSLPVSDNGAFIINYPGRWNKSFKRLSYFAILKAYQDTRQGIKPQIDLSIIKGKVCFIGLTATGTSDLKATPLENIYPMVGLQASIFNSIIRESFIREVGRVFNTFINILIFMFSLFVCLRLRPTKALLGNLGLGFIYFVIATGLFVFYGIWVGLFLPLCIITLTYICATAYRFFMEMRRRELLEQELEIARTIQKSFLPPDIKEFRRLSISSFMQPAKFVAGDFYDILALDEQRLAVLMGDVSGKGVPAALIMAQAISLFRIFCRQNLKCSQVLGLLNKELCGKFQGRFVTCLYMLIDVDKGDVRVCSAGQSPLLLQSNNIISEIELGAGFPLGIMEDVDYQDITFNIGQGDKVIAFSDGLYEARNSRGKEFGLENVKGIIMKNKYASCESLINELKEEVFNFAKHTMQHDDITLLAYGYRD